MNEIYHPVRSQSAASARMMRNPRDARSDRLRITVVVDVFPALSETFVLDQVIALIEMGHEVRVIADAPRRESTVHDEVAEYNLLRITRYLQAQSRSRKERLAVLLRAMRSNSLRVAGTLFAFRLARNRAGETGEMSGLAATITALAEAPRPDVVLCHFGPSGSRAVRALEALQWDVPVVTIFHGFDLTRLVQQRGPNLYENLFSKGALFLPACEFFAGRLRAMGCPPERIKIQRMCVDPVKIDGIVSSLDAKPPGPGMFTFVTVGRLVSKKGHIHAIRAFARVFANRPSDPVRLRVIGDGPLRAKLENVAREAGVADRVEFLGSLRRREVLSTVLTADALIQASVTAPDGDMEGVPVVISEAIALRKPVIGTRHSGIPDLVVDDVTGKLVDEGNEAALAESMAWMVRNRPDSQKMGQAGRRRLETDFTATTWNGLLEQRLRNVAAGQLV